MTFYPKSTLTRMESYLIIFFVITLFGFFFVGDGLRDALDPKDR